LRGEFGQSDEQLQAKALRQAEDIQRSLESNCNFGKRHNSLQVSTTPTKNDLAFAPKNIKFRGRLQSLQGTSSILQDSVLPQRNTNSFVSYTPKVSKDSIHARNFKMLADHHKKMNEIKVTGSLSPSY